MIERAMTLAEERALGWHDATGRGSWWGHGKGIPRVSCGRLWSGEVVAGRSAIGGRVVPAISLPRLAARQRALELAAPHRTPRPGEGRAPTTAG